MLAAHELSLSLGGPFNKPIKLEQGVVAALLAVVDANLFSVLEEVHTAQLTTMRQLKEDTQGNPLLKRPIDAHREHVAEVLVCYV